MMRLDRWWPMKPFTPRMRIFFIGCAEWMRAGWRAGLF
jgi:hypothetical protein